MSPMSTEIPTGGPYRTPGGSPPRLPRLSFMRRTLCRVGLHHWEMEWTPPPGAQAHDADWMRWSVHSMWIHLCCVCGARRRELPL